MNDPRVSLFLADPLPKDVKRSIERTLRLDDVIRVAIMPDVHLAGDFCVGCVIATRDTIYPHAVGGDIGCGMAAVPFDQVDDPFRIDSGRADRILRGLKQHIPIMSRMTPLRTPELDEVLDDPLSRPDLDRLRRKDAPRQLGTLGRGNHFLELQRSFDDGRLWLCVHTGSRGLGPAIRDAHAKDGRDGLPSGSERGQAYLHDLRWARRFAHQNRMSILALACNVLSDTLGAEPSFDECISSDHNHVEEEMVISAGGSDRIGCPPGSTARARFTSLSEPRRSSPAPPDPQRSTWRVAAQTKDYTPRRMEREGDSRERSLERRSDVETWSVPCATSGSTNPERMRSARRHPVRTRTSNE